MNLSLNNFKFVFEYIVNMKSKEVRKRFFDFFASKNHTFQKSSSIVIKDDPTLLFVNAGMNQFKNIFLDYEKPTFLRVMNSQKCLRVSGKHNDLEEVGHDTYHHTMFEMLGNWSFGDYFKKDAIHLAWDFLTKELGVPKDRLYVSFFKGDDDDKLKADDETKIIWNKIVDADKVVEGNKKDNFWEMGPIGPCGPSTEIHIDLRTDSEREKISGRDLINQDHPQLIEIWNIVFIEFNRKENGTLDLLPKKHVDTGMGFERLCMLLQNKKSTYDTDIFSNLIARISSISKINYGSSKEHDVAIRVIVDHIRAITFCIADGQLPSNTGAGYVIRRILRRAVRYGYTYLNLKNPFLYLLVSEISTQFEDVFPEIKREQEVIQNIIKEEENSFLKTLGKGLALIQKLIENNSNNSSEINGKRVFELYDTYGFPPDLTALILKEKGLLYNQEEFKKSMLEQKNRSRTASEVIVGDWVDLSTVGIEGFVGYDDTRIVNVSIVKYRKCQFKGDCQFHLVFNKTPFYPEGGGQVGDSGQILLRASKNNQKSINILDTKKENNLIIHITTDLPNKGKDLKDLLCTLQVDTQKRRLTSRNHSATHLLHHVLRLMLGNHVEQKGSYVCADYLRFDFSHFQKIDKNEILKLENKINAFIVKGIALQDFRSLPIAEAKDMGALALFGEKYGDNVRVVKFGDSVELCGGTHVLNTSEIGFVKIKSESSVASGVRRIEAVSSAGAIQFANAQMATLEHVNTLLKSSVNVTGLVKKMLDENKALNELAKEAKKHKSHLLLESLIQKVDIVNNHRLFFDTLDVDVASMKDICFSLINKYDNAVVALVTIQNKKAILNIALSKKLLKTKEMDASVIINQVGPHINARGGGQSFFAVASGDNIKGLENLFLNLKERFTNL